MREKLFFKQPSNERNDKESEKKLDVAVQKDFNNAFWAAYGNCRNEQEKFPEMVRLIYTALYDPDNISNSLVDDVRREQRLTELGVLSGYANLKNVPSMDEFMTAFRLSFRHGSEVGLNLNGSVSYSRENTGLSKEQDVELFKDALYPDVEKAIVEFWDEYSARMIIWTAGDESSWKGQFYKVASAVHKLRKNQEFGTEEKSERLSIVARANKLNDLPEVLKRMNSMGVEKIIFLEDKLRMLENGYDKLNESVGDTGLLIVPVWVRRDGNKFAKFNGDIADNDKKVLLEKYNAVRSFGEVKKSLEEKEIIASGDKLGIISDFDGVLSDADISDLIWVKSMIGTLSKNNWINS